MLKHFDATNSFHSVFSVLDKFYFSSFLRVRYYVLAKASLLYTSYISHTDDSVSYEADMLSKWC